MYVTSRWSLHYTRSVTTARTDTLADQATSWGTLNISSRRVNDSRGWTSSPFWLSLLSLRHRPENFVEKKSNGRRFSMHAGITARCASMCVCMKDAVGERNRQKEDEREAGDWRGQRQEARSETCNGAVRRRRVDWGRIPMGQYLAQFAQCVSVIIANCWPAALTR